MSMLQKGYLLIADITGYTAYLSDSELEHAHHVLQSLLELLLDHTRPPLVISRLAGDAVISYGLQQNFGSGQTFVEMIEDTYVAFRKAINLMVLNNTCQCNACANISSLDLKFFVHFGSFTLQRLDNHEELLGSDVNLLHRLLKNRVVEKTGLRAYTLYTQPAIESLGLDGFQENMIAHREEYEHLGAIDVWLQDMHPVWEAKQESLKIGIPPEQIILRMSEEFPASVEAMWDILTEPRYRAPLHGSLSQHILNRQNGRIVPGSQFQCFHGGNRESMQTILEWHPFDQMTTEDTTPVPRTTVLINLRIAPTGSGTKLTVTASRAKGPALLRIACDVVARLVLPKTFATGLAKLRVLIEEDRAAGKYGFSEPVSVPVEQIREAASVSLRET